MYSNQSYDVHCQFDPASGLTWTRLQSYQMQQRETFETPFMINRPRNEDTPSNINYRLSRQRMESIRQDSRYWAISCWSYSGLDSISVSLNKLDILTYEGAEACFEVEYVAVGSQNCSKRTAKAGGCTVLLKQSSSEPIHSIYYQPDTKNIVPSDQMTRLIADQQARGKRTTILDSVNAITRTTDVPNRRFQQFRHGLEDSGKFQEFTNYVASKV